MPTKRIILIAMMTCLISICSWINIPSALPFTMQTFAVFCALLLLGGQDGLLVFLLYFFMVFLDFFVFVGFMGGFV